MRFAEIRVTRSGAAVKKLEWDPQRDGAAVYDLTRMRVLKVEREISAAGDAPSVRVTFMARLVEVDEESNTDLSRP